ncbi:MAG: alpha/beta hydrolase [Actinobacteria bacterium]|nr:alpha/beta hydrolase [Actinomycetota bacterium]
METTLSVQVFDDDREHDAARVVLVHGAMDRGASFSRVVGYLHDLVVTTYDRRGYAHSMDATVATALDDHVNDLIGILEGHSSVVIGHSLGGVIALAAASRRPELVQSAGVYESPMPWLDWWPSSTAGAQTLADSSDPGKAAENFMRFLVSDDAWEMLPMKTQQQRRAEGPALLADLQSLRTVETPPFDPETLPVPVGVAGGAETRQHHKDGCEAMAKMFDTEVQWIDGAGHGGHMSHPGPFAKFVRRCTGMRNL